MAVSSISKTVSTTDLTPVTTTNLPTGSSIVGVSASMYNTYVLYANGNVYGAGKNNIGQLGTGTAGTSSTILVKANINEPIKRITTGESHVLALTANGEIYAWGNNMFVFV